MCSNSSNAEPATSQLSLARPEILRCRSLPLVLGDVPKVGRVIVVDNGSTDATAEVAAQYGATVVVEPRRGYGAACLRGLAAIRELIENGKAAHVRAICAATNT